MTAGLTREARQREAESKLSELWLQRQAGGGDSQLDIERAMTLWHFQREGRYGLEVDRPDARALAQRLEQGEALQDVLLGVPPANLIAEPEQDFSLGTGSYGQWMRAKEMAREGAAAAHAIQPVPTTADIETLRDIMELVRRAHDEAKQRTRASVFHDPGTAVGHGSFVSILPRSEDSMLSATTRGPTYASEGQQSIALRLPAPSIAVSPSLKYPTSLVGIGPAFPDENELGDHANANAIDTVGGPLAKPVFNLQRIKQIAELNKTRPPQLLQTTSQEL